MSHGKLLFVPAVALLLMSSLASAGEGRIPIWAPVVLDGTLGSIDGKYVVTRNIAAAAGPAIEIRGVGTDEVDIDLNGFTLSADPSGAFDIVVANDLATLVIRNGSLRSGNPPAGGNSLVVRDSAKVVAEDLRIQGGGTGVLLESVAAFEIRRNRIVGADPSGIFVDAAGGIVARSTGTVEGNIVTDSGVNGIVVTNNHSSVSVTDNRVDRTLGGTGIVIGNGDACLVSRNTVEESALDGILLDQANGCKVHNNVTIFNGCSGVTISGENNLVLDNGASRNSHSGIRAFGRDNQFERNTLNDNACFGLELGSGGNVYGRNMARRNSGTGAGVCPQICDPSVCAVAIPTSCPAPLGGGSAQPDLCIGGPQNDSLCDNMMPGPPAS